MRHRWLSALALSLVAGCGSSSRTPGDAHPTTLLPAPSATAPRPTCEVPALAPALAAAIRRELASPALQNSAGFKTTPTMGRVRIVRELFPPTATRPGVTAVVFDASAAGRTLTLGLPVRVSATRTAVEDDLGGLVPLDTVGTGAIPVHYGRAFFANFVFSYGTVSMPAGSTVTETFVTRNETEAFDSPVCNGAFALGGVGQELSDFLTHDVLEFTSAAGASLLRLELDPGPVD
jgi:hypothetical protein